MLIKKLFINVLQHQTTLFFIPSSISIHYSELFLTHDFLIVRRTRLILSSWLSYLPSQRAKARNKTERRLSPSLPYNNLATRYKRNASRAAGYSSIIQLQKTINSGRQRATVSGYTRGSARTRSRERGRRMARVAERI